jgi:hypothetical protein
MAADRQPATLTARSNAGERAIAIALWALALAGFIFYIAKFDSIHEAYGSIGTTIVTLMWLILISALYYAIPSLKLERSGEPELEQLVRSALEDGADHEGVWSARAGGLERITGEPTTIEYDLNDWGFAYGVAWAIAKRQYPSEPDREVAERALAAARKVFEDQGRLADRAPAGDTSGGS